MVLITLLEPIQAAMPESFYLRWKSVCRTRRRSFSIPVGVVDEPVAFRVRRWHQQRVAHEAPVAVRVRGLPAADAAVGRRREAGAARRPGEQRVRGPPPTAEAAVHARPRGSPGRRDGLQLLVPAPADDHHGQDDEEQDAEDGGDGDHDGAEAAPGRGRGVDRVVAEAVAVVAAVARSIPSPVYIGSLLKRNLLVFPFTCPQGGPSRLGPGFGWLGFLIFLYLTRAVACR